MGSGTRRNKLIYNNYQFYEIQALSEFLKMQESKGYQFTGALGQFLNIMKFKASNDQKKHKFYVFHKYLDNEIDTAIDTFTNNSDKNTYQNGLYYICEEDYQASPDENLSILETKQNILAGVKLKQAIISVTLLFIISIILFTLKLKLQKFGFILFNKLNFGISIALLITFLFYFIGDLHDFIKGKGIIKNGKLFFASRTSLKDQMFKFGDFLKISTLLISIFVSIFMALNARTIVVSIELFRIWFVILSIGFTTYIKYHRSYVGLLLIEILLLATSFWSEYIGLIQM